MRLQTLSSQHHIKQGLLRFALIAAGVVWAPAVSLATTKGLSQIVMPELEDPGDLSISFRAQSDEIGNPYQFQADLV